MFHIFPPRSGALLVAVFAVLAGCAGARTGSSGEPSGPYVLRLNPYDAPARLTANDHGCQLAISPDGSRVVFPDGDGRLMIRDLRSGESKLLVQNWGARDAFFSADGAAIGYFAGNRFCLKTAGGGERNLIERLPGHAKGACWTPEGIVFSPSSNAGLWRISPEGGAPTKLTEPDPSRREQSHRWPSALPDGRGLIFTIKSRDIANFNEGKVAVYDARSRSWRVLVNGGTCGRFAPTGHLVWAREGNLYAAPFDVETLTLDRDATRVVLEGVRTQNESGAAMYAFSDDGVLVYMAGGPTEPRQELVWVHRNNDIERVLTERAFFGELVMSRDGSRVAIPAAGANDTIWIFDVASEDLRRFTHDGNCGSPAWTSDGKELVFLSDRGGPTKVYRKRLDGGGDASELFGSPTLAENFGNRMALAPNDEHLALARNGDILLVDVSGGVPPRPLAATPEVSEANPAFSPDGEHIAYVANERGMLGIFVRAVASDAAPVLVARVAGGAGSPQPHWSADGQVLLYLTADTIHEVALRKTPKLEVASSRKVALVENASGFCAHPDGQRFLVCRKVEQPTKWDVRVVVGWWAILRGS